MSRRFVKLGDDELSHSSSDLRSTAVLDREEAVEGGEEKANQYEGVEENAHEHKDAVKVDTSSSGSGAGQQSSSSDKSGSGSSGSGSGSSGSGKSGSGSSGSDKSSSGSSGSNGSSSASSGSDKSSLGGNTDGRGDSSLANSSGDAGGAGEDADDVDNTNSDDSSSGETSYSESTSYSDSLDLDDDDDDHDDDSSLNSDESESAAEEAPEDYDGEEELTSSSDSGAPRAKRRRRNEQAKGTQATFAAYDAGDKSACIEFTPLDVLDGGRVLGVAPMCVLAVNDSAFLSALGGGESSLLSQFRERLRRGHICGDDALLATLRAQPEIGDDATVLTNAFATARDNVDADAIRVECVPVFVMLESVPRILLDMLRCPDVSRRVRVRLISAKVPAPATDTWHCAVRSYYYAGRRGDAGESREAAYVLTERQLARHAYQDPANLRRPTCIASLPTAANVLFRFNFVAIEPLVARAKNIGAALSLDVGDAQAPVEAIAEQVAGQERTSIAVQEDEDDGGEDYSGSGEGDDTNNRDEGGEEDGETSVSDKSHSHGGAQEVSQNDDQAGAAVQQVAADGALAAMIRRLEQERAGKEGQDSPNEQPQPVRRGLLNVSIMLGVHSKVVFSKKHTPDASSFAQAAELSLRSAWLNLAPVACGVLFEQLLDSLTVPESLAWLRGLRGTVTCLDGTEVAASFRLWLATHVRQLKSAGSRKATSSPLQQLKHRANLGKKGSLSAAAALDAASKLPDSTWPQVVWHVSTYFAGVLPQAVHAIALFSSMAVALRCVRDKCVNDAFHLLFYSESPLDAIVAAREDNVAAQHFRAIFVDESHRAAELGRICLLLFARARGLSPFANGTRIEFAKYSDILCPVVRCAIRAVVMFASKAADRVVVETLAARRGDVPPGGGISPALVDDVLSLVNKATTRVRAVKLDNNGAVAFHAADDDWRAHRALMRILAPGGSFARFGIDCVRSETQQSLLACFGARLSTVLGACRERSAIVLCQGADQFARLRALINELDDDVGGRVHIVDVARGWVAPATSFETKAFVFVPLAHSISVTTIFLSLLCATHAEFGRLWQLRRQGQLSDVDDRALCDAHLAVGDDSRTPASQRVLSALAASARGGLCGDYLYVAGMPLNPVSLERLARGDSSHLQRAGPSLVDDLFFASAPENCMPVDEFVPTNAAAVSGELPFVSILLLVLRWHIALDLLLVIAANGAWRWLPVAPLDVAWWSTGSASQLLGESRVGRIGLQWWFVWPSSCARCWCRCRRRHSPSTGL